LGRELPANGREIKAFVAEMQIFITAQLRLFGAQVPAFALHIFTKLYDVAISFSALEAS
jgi:hypothetical protein